MQPYHKLLAAIIFVVALITFWCIFDEYSAIVFETYHSTLNYQTKAINDSSMLIDLKNFEFIINRKLCKSESFIILVHSAVENWSHRNLIRQTWGTYGKVHVNFLLGAVNSTALQQQILRESNAYEDIIQGNFMDTYRNLTYKHAMALKWFQYYCAEAKYLVKTDDDIIVNIPNLMTTLKHGQKKLILCKSWLISPVVRDLQSKWYVRPDEYKQNLFPKYCSGFAIIYSADTVRRLYTAVQKTPYFWIDDVHITGTLRQSCQFNLTNSVSYYLPPNIQTDVLNGTELAKNKINKFLFSSPNMSEAEMFKLWTVLSKIQ